MIETTKYIKNEVIEKAINKILKRAKLFENRDKKLWRIINDPLWTPIYFVLNIASRVKPFWISKKMPWGEKMSFYLPEGNQIFYYGFCESNLAIFLLRIINAGDTFVDIGANIGYYTMLASYLVGESGKVLSVEATPRTFSTLEKNIRKNKNITAVNIALSDSDQEITLMDYGSKYSGSNSLNPKMPKEVADFIKTKGVEIKIKTTTLDKFIKNKHFVPTFIKLDVEGYESNILKGMTKVLNNDRPIFSVEMCKHPEWKDNVNETFKLLIDKHYVSFEISPLGYLKPITQDNYETIDIVFVPMEKIDSIKHLLLENNK